MSVEAPARTATASGLAAAQVGAVTTLVDRQSAARDTIARNTASLVLRLFSVFTQWYSEQAVLGLAAQANRHVTAGQQQTANLTSEYLRQVLRQLGVDTGDRAGVALPAQGLRGIDFLEEWSRPAETYRFERSTGADDAVALQRAVARAQQLASDDLTLGMREGARQRLDRTTAQVTAFRRVIHPELSKTGTCGLCIAASDRTYSRGDLLPVHGRCRCEVLPVLDGMDPGAEIDAKTLGALYKAAGSTAAADLKGVRVQYDENNELGPVIAPAGTKVRTAGQAEAARRTNDRSPSSTPSQQQAYADQLDRLERSLPTFQAMADTGDKNALALVAARTARITDLRRRLGR